MTDNRTTALRWFLVLLYCTSFAACDLAQAAGRDTSEESSENLPANRDTEINEAASVAGETAEIEALIDQLVNVGAEGVGFHSTAWASGFLAIEEQPQFGGGVLGSVEPVASEPMRALVQQGVAALPSLIEHLSDEREATLEFRRGQGIIMSQWHSDEYDPRFREPRLQPSGVNTGNEVRNHNYQLTVGDLCYVAIGQIVNRRLNAVRYQPTGCRVINSPVQQPALAAAVRADWQGLTEEEHRESLSQDALVEAYAAAAINRLHFYYPERGEELALKLLNRPPVNVDLVSRFISRKLLPESDPLKWKELIDEFRKQSRAADADSIPLHFMWWSIYVGQQGEDSPSAQQYASARKTFDQVYPHRWAWMRINKRLPSCTSCTRP